MFIPIIAVVVLNSMTYCKNGHKKSEQNVHDTLLTKTIVFPDSLYWLVNEELYPIDSLQSIIKDKTKIISIIDATCMKCIVNQLNKIDSIFYDIIPDNNFAMVYILNFNQSDSLNFMRNLYPAIKARGYKVWDNNYHFETRNNLFTRYIELRTFMINSKNKIVQYGNPLFKPDIITEYEEKMVNQ